MELERHLVARVFSLPPAFPEASLLVVLYLGTTASVEVPGNLVAAIAQECNTAAALETRKRTSDDPSPGSLQTFPDDSTSFASLSSSSAAAEDFYRPNVETGYVVVLTLHLDSCRCSSFDRISRLRYLEECSNRFQH